MTFYILAAGKRTSERGVYRNWLVL